MYGCELDVAEINLEQPGAVPTWLGRETLKEVTPKRILVRCGVLKRWLDSLGLPEYTPTKLRTFNTEQDFIDAAHEVDYEEPVA